MYLHNDLHICDYSFLNVTKTYTHKTELQDHKYPRSNHFHFTVAFKRTECRNVYLAACVHRVMKLAKDSK